MNMVHMHEMVFQHLIEMPSFNGIFCSAKECASGKTRLFRLFKNNKKVYLRNGIKGTWEELPNEPSSNLVQDVLNKVIKERKIPAFRYDGGKVHD